MAIYERSVSHNISVTSAGAPTLPEDVETTLTIDQLIVESNGRFIAHELVVTSTVELNWILTQPISHALTVAQTINAYLVEAMESGTLGTDTDFIISTADLDTLTAAELDALTALELDLLVLEDAITYEAPTVVADEPLIVEPTGSYAGWSDGSPVQSVTMPTPDTGTKHELLTFTKSRRTAGGTRRQVRPAAWETADRLTWTYSNMSSVQLADFLQFASEQAARSILLKDEYDRTWFGMIVSTLIKINQLTRNRVTGVECNGNNALYQITFDFEGALVA